MKLYIGGLEQGQNELAKAENPDASLCLDYHLRIEEQVRAGEDPIMAAQKMLEEEPDIVISCCEIGRGIVPIEMQERALRDLTGRVQCFLACRAETVVHCICGIGRRIK